MINTIAAIAAGGALGALARHYTNIGVMAVIQQPFPYGTLTANILGSFIMGTLIALFAAGWDVSQGVKLFLTVGFLGAFTTFSTFSLDTMTLITRGDLMGAFTYMLGSVVLSITAVFLGSFLVWKVMS